MDKEKLQQGLAEYDAKVAKATAKFPERKEFAAQRLYTPLDVEGFDYGEKLGFPGQYPFTKARLPGAVSVYARRAADNVPRTPVDDARLCRFRHGGRNQRPL